MILTETMTPLLYVLLAMLTSRVVNAEVLNIAHRGSSGLLPEHTVAAYQRAIEEGAHYIECDVVLTRDLVPICRHEPLLNDTTDIANRVQFRDRVNTHSDESGWFSIDLTLAEIKQLRAVQHVDFRDQSHNGLYEVSTLEEYILLAQEAGVGIYPEIKQPDWHNALLPEGERIEDIVMDMLGRYGYDNKDSDCFLQCFNEQSLHYVRTVRKSDIKIIMLMWIDVTDADLDRYVASGFDGVGCWKDQIAKHYNDEHLYKNWIWEHTDFVERCHARRLLVHVYTFRNEDRYLAWDFKQDAYNEYMYFMRLGVDGMFTDFPASLRQFVAWTAAESYPMPSATTRLQALPGMLA